MPQEKNTAKESIKQLEFKEKLHQDYKKEESKNKLIETINDNPQILKNMSNEQLKELNVLYEEIIKNNKYKITELKGKRERESENSVPVIKQNIKDKYNSTYILRFYYNRKMYVQAFENDSLKTVYFIAENNIVNPIIDENLISKFKALYEIKPSSIVYSKFEKNIIDLDRELQQISPKDRFNYIWNLVKQNQTSVIIDFFVRTDINNEDKLWVVNYLMPYTSTILNGIVDRYKEQAKEAKLPESDWIEREEDAELIKEIICKMIVSDEEKIELLRDSIPRRYTNLWEEVICSLESKELKQRFLTVFQNKGFGNLLKDALKPQEYKEYIVSFVSETLEGYELFTKVYGVGFATERMNKLKGVVLKDESHKEYNGLYSTEDETITLFDVQQNDLQEFSTRKNKKSVMLHESIHHILRIGNGVTGIQSFIKGQYVGTGLNEGFTEWVCKKTGVGASASGTYEQLGRFIEQIELAIGEENTMSLGMGSLENDSKLMNVSVTDIYTLLLKADAVYQIGMLQTKGQAIDTSTYDDAVCEFESMIFALFFEREFEELRKKPLDKVDLSKFEQLAKLMGSKLYGSDEYESVWFLRELDTIKRTKENPLLAKLLEINPNLIIHLNEPLAIALNEYILSDTNPIESLEIIMASSNNDDLQNVTILANGKDAIRGKYTIERGPNEQYRVISHTETYLSSSIMIKFEEIKKKALENNPNAQVIITDYSIIIRGEDGKDTVYLIDEKNNTVVQAEEVETISLKIPEPLRIESEERRAIVLRNKIKEQEMSITQLENTPLIVQTEEKDQADTL